MKKYLLFNYIIVSLIFVSCGTTSKSVVSTGVNLAKYKYVSLIDNDTYRMPAELIQYQIQLYDAVERSGLTMVNQYRIGELTQDEQSSLLLATFGVDVRKEETCVTVNFIDFNTGRPLVSCKGAYTTLGINQDADIKGAIKHVSEQITKTFK